MTKITDDLVKIARAGGSIEMDAGTRITDDLVKIARALKPGATLRLHNSSKKITDGLMKIVRAAADGAVIVVV